MVTVHLQGKQAKVTLFTLQGGGILCSGTFDTTTRVIAWGADYRKIVGSTWTRSVADTTLQTSVQVEGIKTEPGGKSLDMCV